VAWRKSWRSEDRRYKGERWTRLCLRFALDNAGGVVWFGKAAAEPPHSTLAPIVLSVRTLRER
jgi:hypothetical protein